MHVTRTGPFWWGILLIVLGGIWLLDESGAVELSSAWAALIFAVPGLYFAALFVARPDRWWAAMPAGALLGLAGLVAWEELTAAEVPEWGAALFLAAIGLGFAAVYLRAPRQWWAIIPAGTLLSIALMVALEPALSDVGIVAVLFGGLAATFGLLGLVAVSGRRMRWPLIPAAILAVMAAAFAIAGTRAGEALELIWPILAIAVGLFLVWRTLVDRGRPSPHP